MVSFLLSLICRKKNRRQSKNCRLFFYMSTRDVKMYVITAFLFHDVLRIQLRPLP